MTVNQAGSTLLALLPTSEVVTAALRGRACRKGRICTAPRSKGSLRASTELRNLHPSAFASAQASPSRSAAATGKCFAGGNRTWGGIAELCCAAVRGPASPAGQAGGGNALTEQASPLHSPVLPLQAAARLCPQERMRQAATLAQLPGAFPAPATSCTPRRCSETGFKKGMGAGC